MKTKDLKELSLEELLTQRKNLTAALIIIGVLIVLYLAFFAYKIASGTWESNFTLGVVVLGVLGVVSSTTSARLNHIAKELKRRA